jgi:hypothetical protein
MFMASSFLVVSNIFCSFKVEVGMTCTHKIIYTGLANHSKSWKNSYMATRQQFPFIPVSKSWRGNMATFTKRRFIYNMCKSWKLGNHSSWIKRSERRW